jgi:hypothetical protein
MFEKDQSDKKRRREVDDWDDSRPFDMDNYYSGKQFSVGGVDFDLPQGKPGAKDDEWHSARFSHDNDRGYTGKGPKGYKRSDESIREDACEALYRNRFVDAGDIDVTTKDGCVYLRGTVDSRNAKREAESCIENLSGVEDVHNELRVRKIEL